MVNFIFMFSYILSSSIRKDKIIPALRKLFLLIYYFFFFLKKGHLDLLVYGYKFHNDKYKKIMFPYLLSARYCE